MKSQDSRTHIGRVIQLAGLLVVIALAAYPAMAQDISRLGQWYQQTEMEKGQLGRIPCGHRTMSAPGSLPGNRFTMKCCGAMAAGIIGP